MCGYAVKGGKRNVSDYPYGCPDARDERLRCGKSDTKDGRPPKGEYPHCRNDGKRLFRGQTSGTGCRDERPYRKADRYEHSCIDPAEIPLMRTESRRIKVAVYKNDPNTAIQPINEYRRGVFPFLEGIPGGFLVYIAVILTYKPIFPSGTQGHGGI